LRGENNSLTQQVEELESTNQQLESTNRELETANQELRATLDQYAVAASSRTPTLPLNYSSERNNLDSLSFGKRKRKRRSKRSVYPPRPPGRKPKHEKTDLADRVVPIYQRGVPHDQCKLRYEQ
jgi:regulator of replication initiation timing